MSHPLLSAPIGRSLIKSAGPTTALMLVQVLVTVVDGMFVGRLGIEALAGTALVIPFITLMFNIAHGGMGGGVAASMACALGAGRQDDAQAILTHSLILAAGLSAGFTVFDWTCAAWLFQLLGGNGIALEMALTFSHVTFAGSAAIDEAATPATSGSSKTVRPTVSCKAGARIASWWRGR